MGHHQSNKETKRRLDWARRYNLTAVAKDNAWERMERKARRNYYMRCLTQIHEEHQQRREALQ
jgi:hypothetical protein